MTLPLSPPVAPQLARSRKTLPEGGDWVFEPKWDGFRALAFVDGDEVVALQSRNGKDLLRYFPELRFPPGRYVLDGEIVIPAPAAEGDTVARQEFDLLGQRIHPAASRIARLAQETPATFMAFDLLAREDEILLDRSWEERRAALEALIGDPVELTPVVRSAQDAQPWLQGAEGVIAKEASAPYRPGERTGMVKVKRVRTIDAVVAGWRPGKEEGTVGSLILALHEPGGRLREVGHSSGFTAREKRELVGFLAPYETGERGSGEPSRWTAGRDLEWVKLRPELVVEVTFDHVSDGRIRHGAKVQRWREDKDPAACGVEQLDQ
ncbi:MAG: ATP-dependent DNA ligase [Actinomycetota bacterium]|nr:ATP-dependent DNA ligase [Solirubrobacterales bacterium]MBA3862238.1 ATP-dependent DNA ligase [Solirubrobacterales bacterium]MDQ3092959.1 ATP-dependent DNA ligase [Actinomycetota bacterium]MDQ3372181.1 ATP-dependent DNA ligase [Actinomycetota bacterium]